jgi:hypothetical protein
VDFIFGNALSLYEVRTLDTKQRLPACSFRWFIVLKALFAGLL